MLHNSSTEQRNGLLCRESRKRYSGDRKTLSALKRKINKKKTMVHYISAKIMLKIKKAEN